MWWSWRRLRRCLNYRSETTNSSPGYANITVLFIYPLPAPAEAGKLTQTLVSVRRQRDRGKTKQLVYVYLPTVPPVRRLCFHSISSSPFRPQPPPVQTSPPWRTGTAGQQFRFSSASSSLLPGRPAPPSHRRLQMGFLGPSRCSESHQHYLTTF